MKLVEMPFVVLTILFLVAATVGAVALAYWIGLKCGWIPKAKDERQAVGELTMKVRRLEEEKNNHEKCVLHFQEIAAQLAGALAVIIRRNEDEKAIENAKETMLNIVKDRINQQETHHGR